MKIFKKKCGSILSNSGLYGTDYSINPFKGCPHDCRYCYAAFMEKYTDHGLKWGEFVEVKTNAEEVLKKEIRRKRKGKIILSTVTDPYQYLEKKHKITRKILKLLSKTGYRTSILTKSPLIKRDLDIFKKFRRNNISLGFTINFLEEKDRKIWEPNAPKISKRIKTLKKLPQEEIKTYIHVGPYLDGITNLPKIVERFKDIVDEFQIETLNPGPRSREIRETLKEHYPSVQKKYLKNLDKKNKSPVKLQKKTKNLRKEIDTPINLYL